MEFTHQILTQFITPSAQEIINCIYQTVEQQYDTSTATGSLETGVANIKKLLSDTRKSTSLQYMCFKKPK
jgi:exocyst complex component 2